MDQNGDKPAQPVAPPGAPPEAKDAAKPKRGPITRLEDLPTVEEIGGPEGPEPTRFGDWSVKGRVSDF